MTRWFFSLQLHDLFASIDDFCRSYKEHSVKLVALQIKRLILDDVKLREILGE
jgi:hypothetical protein